MMKRKMLLAGVAEDNVYVDFLIQPELRPQLDSSASVTNAQVFVGEPALHLEHLPLGFNLIS